MTKQTASAQEPSGTSPVAAQTDFLLVGAGLANSLIALFLHRYRPDATFLMVEKGDRVAGNHTWSFHTTDLDPEHFAFLEPLLPAKWPSQEVWFPKYRRELSTGYNSMTSQSLAAAAQERFGDRIRLNCGVSEIGPNEVVLDDGTRLTARAVIDGRGYRPSDALELAFQKFCGVEYAFEDPHGVKLPVIMDATVAQEDGYRFIYNLPFTPKTLLVEDTYYADGPQFDKAEIHERIEDYMGAQGWPRARTVIREEQGILPIALSADINRFWDEVPTGVTQSGLRAALFHPITGYSLPDAVRLAALIAKEGPADARALFEMVRAHSIRTWERRGMFILLNRMLFKAARPHERRQVLQRFYTLPQPLIERFYAASLRKTDNMRILFGKPPIPISRALVQLVPPGLLPWRTAS